jgi:hypothetical protein
MTKTTNNGVAVRIGDVHRYGKPMNLPDIGQVEVDEDGIVEDVPEYIAVLLVKSGGWAFADESSILDHMTLGELVQHANDMNYPFDEYHKFTKNEKLMLTYIGKKMKAAAIAAEGTEMSSEDLDDEIVKANAIPFKQVVETKKKVEDIPAETEATEEAEENETSEETEEETTEETEDSEDIDYESLSYTELVSLAKENYEEEEFSHIRSKKGMIEYFQSKI